MQDLDAISTAVPLLTRSFCRRLAPRDIILLFYLSLFFCPVEGVIEAVSVPRDPFPMIFQSYQPTPSRQRCLPQR
ncbi:hypothetical protein J6590_047829 [Homalodisca vitripennis]|nr:hypothetical protein J6590_047829 [Homalodisca vitripennis]